MLGHTLIIIGAVLTAGSILTALYLAVLACVMMTAGCNTGGIILLVQLMASGEGIPFWIAIILGLCLIWYGRRMKNQSTRHRASDQ